MATFLAVVWLIRNVRSSGGKSPLTVPILLDRLFEVTIWATCHELYAQGLSHSRLCINVSYSHMVSFMASDMDEHQVYSIAGRTRLVATPRTSSWLVYHEKEYETRSIELVV